MLEMEEKKLVRLTAVAVDVGPPVVDDEAESLGPGDVDFPLTPLLPSTLSLGDRDNCC